MEDQDEDVPSFFPVLAHLKGHKNADPPSIMYVPESGCLVTGEKSLRDAEKLEL